MSRYTHPQGWSSSLHGKNVAVTKQTSLQSSNSPCHAAYQRAIHIGQGQGTPPFANICTDVPGEQLQCGRPVLPAQECGIATMHVFSHHRAGLSPIVWLGITNGVIIMIMTSDQYFCILTKVYFVPGAP